MGAPEVWDFYWQNLPLVDLRANALQSLWHLHAQPPLWNALNVPLIRLFGRFHLVALQGLHIALGSATSALVVVITARLTASRNAGIVAGLIVALDPALFLFESWVLYEVICAFLVIVIVWEILAAGPEGQTQHLLVALGAATALVLTRSLYHLAFLGPAIAVTSAVARRRRLVFAAGLAMALAPAAWSAKNFEQAGFFGSSSWYGLGLWRVVLFRYGADELNPLLRRGELDPVVTLAPFTPPSRYRPLGYVLESDVPSLARDDLHNINIPAISAAYARSATRLIRRDPWHYVANVAIGYGNFSAPSTEYDLLAAQRAHMGLHVTVWRLLTGLPLVRLFDETLPIGTLGSIFSLLIPLSLVAYGYQIVRRIHRSGDINGVLREELPMVVAAYLILYTTVVGSALELGENVRFKFMIEPLLLAFWTVVAVRWARQRSAPR